MGRKGRKKGYEHTQEEKDAIARGMLKHRIWLRVSKEMLDAANSGDRAMATEIWWLYMENLSFWATIGDEIDPEESETFPGEVAAELTSAAVRILNMSQTSRRKTKQYHADLDVLFAEAQARARQREAEEMRQVLLSTWKEDF
jgi:hypothetical protein